jgi:hypothetical protein
VPLFNLTFLLRGQRPEDLPEMPPQLMVERFPTILWDKHHMILAVPRGMIQSLDVWHDSKPRQHILSTSAELTDLIPRLNSMIKFFVLDGVFS